MTPSVSQVASDPIDGLALDADPVVVDVASPGVRLEIAGCPTEKAFALERDLGVDPIVADVLVRRGYGDPAAAAEFLAGDVEHDHRLMRGAVEIARLIDAHVRVGGRIAVHGDYDVDGVCSTAILVRAIEAIGGDVTWHVPSRFDAGYGLSSAAIERSAERGASLLIAVDCGVTALAEVEHALALGLDVAICDHHVPRGPAGDLVAGLPACPVAHPAIGDYPWPHLCAAAVTYKVARALADLRPDATAAADEAIDLVALATVCDVVPLRDENRSLVRRGLKALCRTTRPGLIELMRVAGVNPLSIDARDLGFRLGPRVNAVGRMASADPAVELLLTRDSARATELAQELDQANQRRRETEQHVLHAAERQARSQRDGYALVVADTGWHPGVLGIVAGRLADQYRRPCIALTVEGAVARGSGRSPSAYDLLAGLNACSALLTRFGGHAVAAGLELPADSVDEFSAALKAHAAGRLGPDDLRPVARADAVAGADQLTLDQVAALAALSPFGVGNPEPRLLVDGARIEDVRPMGAGGAHARFTLSDPGATASGVAFGWGRELRGIAREPGTAIVRLQRNEWRGAVEARVQLEHLIPDATTLDAPIATDAVALIGTSPTDVACVEWRAEAGGVFVQPDSPGPAPAPPHVSTGVPVGAQPWWSAAGGGAGRAVHDRRGRGGLALIMRLGRADESVVGVIADLADQSWDGLRRAASRIGVPVMDFTAAEDLPTGHFDHVVLLDPPTSAAEGVSVTGGAGLIHLAWTQRRIAAGIAAIEASFSLRPAAAALYRAVRAAGSLSGDELYATLREHDPRAVGRALRVLDELALIECSCDAGMVCAVTYRSGESTALDQSPSYRSYMAERSEVIAFLTAQTPVA